MKQKGFTLIEVMVALMVFAVLSSIISQSLSVAIKTRDRFAKPDPEEMRLQLALIIIERDLQQLVNRPITETVGRSEPGLMWDTNTGILAFSRIGKRTAPGDKTPFAIARVGYQLQNHQLYRITWPYLDRLNENNTRQLLLSNVSQIDWQFLGSDGHMYPHWPPTQQWQNEIPLAVTLTLTMKTGPITLWIMTPGQRYAL